MGFKHLLAGAIAAAGLLMAGMAAAQSSAPPPKNLSLDQAVEQVQRQVGGKVLSAEPRQIGHRTEYRIKVLTPEGHVRVMGVPSEVSARPPAAAQSPKKSPNGGSNKKEKH
jgi:hypothetical protein